MVESIFAFNLINVVPLHSERFSNTSIAYPLIGDILVFGTHFGEAKDLQQEWP